jgi:hypothetical protein
MPRERPVSVVPRAVRVVLVAALAAQIAFSAIQPRPHADATALTAPPPAVVLRLASLGEPTPLAGVTTLYLQAFDNQPGISIPFRDLDYRQVTAWLSAILEVDPGTQYPLLLAAQVYSQVPDEARVRQMIAFVHGQFMRDPNRNWRWLAHDVLILRHQLHDDALALQYAREIARLAPAAPDWAKQMHIFILEDLGELESARVLLGALIDSGQITDAHEMHFLLERLQVMQGAEEQSAPLKE